jgi:hypothetical protein
MKVLNHIPVKPTHNLFLFCHLFDILACNCFPYNPQQIILDKTLISFMKLSMLAKKIIRKNLTREKGFFCNKIIYLQHTLSSLKRVLRLGDIFQSIERIRMP